MVFIMMSGQLMIIILESSIVSHQAVFPSHRKHSTIDHQHHQPAITNDQ
jgi:hypothetical protein